VLIQKDNAEILEVACGPGNVTKYLLSQRPSFRTKGIDLAPKMVELARINNPTAEFFVMDIRDISSISKQYDGCHVWFLFSLLVQ
jgi:trans-aconitate methyltransferase